MSADPATTAEFDTVATWTAQAALDLGPDHYVPAGCRGSGGPAALDWLLTTLGVHATTTLLDVGAGVGGPAGYALQARGVRAVLAEPERGACRGARTLFALPVVCADALALPFDDATFHAAWAIGVIDLTADHVGVLSELRRVVRPEGRIGLLVYAAVNSIDDGPQGNCFPPADEFGQLCDAADLQIVDHVALSDIGDEPAPWRARADAVDDLVRRRHENDPAWRTAREQQETMGHLLDSGDIAAHLFALQARQRVQRQTHPIDTETDR